MKTSATNVPNLQSIDAAFKRFLDSFGTLPKELAAMTVDRTADTEDVYRSTVSEFASTVLELVVSATPEDDRTDVRQRLQQQLDDWRAATPQTGA